MTSPSPPYSAIACWCSRRALARTSMIPMSEESSTYSGAASYSPAVRSTRFHLRLVAQPALAQVVALDRGLRRDEALRELRLGHLEAEQRHRAPVVLVQRDVLGHVRDERGFAHRGARRDDDQVAGLEAAGDGVEVGEAGRGAGERAALGGELLPLADLGVQDLADQAEVLLAVVVGDLEDGALGPFDELARRRLVAVDAGLDLVGGGEQAAQQRAVADDLRVLAQVADARGPPR